MPRELPVVSWLILTVLLSVLTSIAVLVSVQKFSSIYSWVARELTRGAFWLFIRVRRLWAGFPPSEPERGLGFIKFKISQCPVPLSELYEDMNETDLTTFHIAIILLNRVIGWDKDELRLYLQMIEIYDEEVLDRVFEDFYTASINLGKAIRLAEDKFKEVSNEET